MSQEEFEKVLIKYLSEHPNINRNDPDTYDLLINEYMCTCKCKYDGDKELFPYPTST